MPDRESQYAPTRSWRVMKFGGTSVSSPQVWETISDQVRGGSESGQHVLVVVSALSGITDLLGRVADEADLASREKTLAEIHLRHQNLISQLNLRIHAEFDRRQQELNLSVASSSFHATPRIARPCWPMVS